MILLGQRASTLVTARGDYPIPLTPVGNRGDCIEQLERARQRREARAYPIHSDAPFPTQAATPVTAGWHNRRFSFAEATEMREEYEAGATIREVTAKHGGSSSTVRAAIRGAGGTLRSSVPPKMPALAPDLVEEMATRHRGGESLTSLSKAYHRDREVITNALREIGVVPVAYPTPEQLKRRDAIVADYLAGDRTGVVAKRYGVDDRTVTRAVKAAGHPLRNMAQSYRLVKRGQA